MSKRLKLSPDVLALNPGLRAKSGRLPGAKRPQNKAGDFLELWQRLAPGLEVPTAEYSFTTLQAWAFDWAWPDKRVAVEIDGGQWVPFGGRHARDSDRRKLNHATADGWRVLRYSPQMLTADPLGVVAEVARALTHIGY